MFREVELSANSGTQTHSEPSTKSDYSTAHAHNLYIIDSYLFQVPIEGRFWVTTLSWSSRDLVISIGASIVIFN